MKTGKTPIKEERLIEDYINQIEAEQLTRLCRTSLYRYRTSGTIRWTKGITRKIYYHRGDLLKLIGF